MGKNVESGVVAFRLPHEDIAALRKIAEMRGITVNAMLRNMMSKRIKQIREEEGW